MQEDRGRTLERKGPGYSRWTDVEKVSVPGLPMFVPDVLSETELEALILRYRIDEIGFKLAQNLLDIDLRARSPSPTPVYDNMGKRVNTREQRGKDKLMAERQRLVERAKALNPSYRPPLDYRPFSTKKIRKIYVPVKDYPDYNFIGLILGPRGMTQRQMEQDTGAKISLRGRGSVRDGKGRSSTKDNNEDDDLHVVISADSEDSLDHAETLVRRLLVPVEEGKNEIKRKQLRKLAEMNGILRDNSYGFEKEERAKRAGPDVYCRWCGETSHPSSDCNQRGKINGGPPPTQKKMVTKEYYDLMQSLGEDVSGMAVQGEQEESFDQFLASVGVESKPAGYGGPPQSYGGPQQGDRYGGSGRYGGNDYGRGGGFRGPQGDNRFPPPSGAADEIPPWELMDQPSSYGSGSGAKREAVDGPLPWEM